MLGRLYLQLGIALMQYTRMNLAPPYKFMMWLVRVVVKAKVAGSLIHGCHPPSPLTSLLGRFMTCSTELRVSPMHAYAP